MVSIPYRRVEVRITVDDLENIMDEETFENFLNLLSYLHSNTELLMDISYEEIEPMTLIVSGDISEARQSEGYI